MGIYESTTGAEMMKSWIKEIHVKGKRVEMNTYWQKQLSDMFRGWKDDTTAQMVSVPECSADDVQQGR